MFKEDVGSRLKEAEFISFPVLVAIGEGSTLVFYVVVLFVFELNIALGTPLCVQLASSSSLVYNTLVILTDF